VTPSVDDVRARRGFALALAGVIGVPVLVGLLTVLPHGWRKAVFVLGLAATGGAGLLGGALARSAMAGTTALRRHAVVGAFLGFFLGVTAAVFLFWTLVSLVI
jgi:hypothetical protein